MGTTMRELIELGGGIRGGRKLKAWTPGGSSTPLLTGEHLDAPLDFEGMQAAGSLLGTAALMVMDDTVCMVKTCLRLTQFYAHESCGKCTPCREGTYWMVQILQRLEAGRRLRGGHHDAARHLRQHLRPVVLRPRRRCDQPDRLRHQVLPGRVRRPLHARSLPVHQARLRPAAPAAVPPLRWSPLMTIAPERRRRRGEHPAAGGPRHADHRRRRGRRPEGDADHPRRRAARASRSRGSATTRCSTRSAPAASASSRSRGSASR